MPRSERWVVSLLVTAAMLGIAADGAGAVVAGEESHRTGSWETTIPVRYLNGQTLDFDHGTSLELHSDLGWGLGLGYNLSEHVNLNLEFAWTSANYSVTFASADVPPGPSANASGTLDLAATQFNATYYFMPKTFTPYLSAGIGWTWVDTNIPAGPPIGGCWWDPWYGYVCGAHQTTFSGTAFSYGLGAGVRFEPKPSFFLRLGLNDNWQDLGSYSSTPDFLSYRFDLGWKF